MKPVIVYLTEEEHEELRKRAFEERVSMSGMLKSLFKFGKKIEPEVRSFVKDTQKLQTPLVNLCKHEKPKNLCKECMFKKGGGK